MADKALDFYMKGLSIKVRQHLFHHMKHEISQTMVKWFLEKASGYPPLRACGFSDDQIQSICDSYANKFEYPNQVMAEHGRPPLFSNPHDVYQSAQEYVELMKDRSKEELVALFGCSYQEYAPADLGS